MAEQAGSVQLAPEQLQFELLPPRPVEVRWHFPVLPFTPVDVHVPGVAVHDRHSGPTQGPGEPYAGFVLHPAGE